MKVLIVEDEQIAAKRLETMLGEVAQDMHVEAKLESVRDAVQWLTVNHADLIFLDIQLSDGLSFHIFEQIELKTPIIFTTAFDQYALRAFKVNSVDYLLKPIDKEDLTQAIAKFREHIQTKYLPDYQALLNLLIRPQYQQRFMVYAGQKIKSIESAQAAFFYVIEKNVFLQTFDNKSYALDYTLDRLEQILEPEMFFRVNRQYIIHYKAITAMLPLSKSRLKIETSPASTQDIVVSYNRMADFRQWINR